jgi:branched-subunit amino acid aminotransferase/4-amino-4-deoxychorismate lyase
VRGAVPIVRLDGRPVGAGSPGPWAARLAAALDRD